LVVAMAAIGVLGGMAVYIGLRAFRRNKDNSLLLAATGFTFITAGTLAGSVGCIFLHIDEVTAHLTESTLVATGLFSIVYSVSRVGQLSRPK
jgi:putative Mn2+ efflux pump MntP